MTRQIEAGIPPATMGALASMCLPEALAAVVRTARRSTVDNHGKPGSWILRVPVETIPAMVDALQYARDRATANAELDAHPMLDARQRERIMQAATSAAEWTDRARAYLTRERRIALRRPAENAILGTSVKVVGSAVEPTSRDGAVCGCCYARIPGCTEPNMGDAPGMTWATGTCASCGATAVVFWLFMSAAYAGS